MSLHVPWMLVGLAALAIPLIIHLLNRRRFEVVEWGAMQFLQVSETTRRRLMLEEVLLMLLRMGLLLVLVLAIAGPFFDTTLPARLGARPERDLVLVLDGSASMAAGDERGNPAPFDLARERILALLDDLGPNDGVALLLARGQVVPLVGELSLDRERLRQAIESVPAPAGGADLPAALREAHAVLKTSQKSEREIVVLGDGQRHGWADPDTLFRWEVYGSELGPGRGEARGKTRLWYLDLSGGRGARPPNYALGPLTATRPVVSVGREVTFQTEVLVYGHSKYQKPSRLRLLVDGRPVRDLTPPPESGEPLKNGFGRVPFSFTHRFGTPGSHLVSVELSPDKPPEAREPGYVPRDRVPTDNRQDLSVEVLTALPVLLVDGDTSPAGPPLRGADILSTALAQQRDTAPAVKPTVVSVQAFTAESLAGEPAPRVVILHNVARLSLAQQEALAGFLDTGGGVLVMPGDRADPTHYNDQLFRNGESWLPGRLERVEGDEAKVKQGARPVPDSFSHPALEIFGRLTEGGLADAVFPRWWRLSAPGRHSTTTLAGMLESGGGRSPFFLERAYKAGRVMLCAVPLDNSWGSNLVSQVPAFVPLMHELVYYLARARSADFNLRPGQPIRYRLPRVEPADAFRLSPPSGPELPLSDRPEPGTYRAEVVPQTKGAMLVIDSTRDAGAYRLVTPARAQVWFVVPPDPREPDLTPATAGERARVAQLTGAKYAEGTDELLGAWSGGTQRQELWLYLLLALIALLCVEVWMTRRLVRGR